MLMKFSGQALTTTGTVDIDYLAHKLLLKINKIIVITILL